MKDTSSKITLVVPFRNIHENAETADAKLVDLVRSLENVSAQLEEIIFVNDHSTDGSCQFLMSCNLKNLKVLNLGFEFKGKKAALELGTKESKTEYIWTLDSDVELKEFQSEEFQRFQSLLKAELIILPVEMKSEFGILKILQTVEWRYLQFLTVASAKLKKPMMCNGANLIFKRKLFLENIESHRSVSSGDDMFLLSHALKSEGGVEVCWENFVTVEVSPVATWVEAITQRVRWAGKTTKLPYTKSTFFHGIFALFSAVHAIAFVGLFVPSFHLICAEFLMVKVLVEVFCLRSASAFRMRGLETIVAFPQMLFYPVFSLAIFVTSLFYKPKWKGRRVSLN